MSQLREFGEVRTGEMLDGRYRLEQRIGEGGMARVYRAEDTVLGRTVAVKILRGALDGLGTVERARSETMLSASLNHHGLVTLFDAHVSEEDGSYLVMEYVEGITLRERIGRGPLDSSEAAALALDLAEGLHVAHSAGVIHRDIKPSNVLLWRSPVPGHEWRAKIADFGIACLRDSSRLTSPGIMVGTVAYVAPEQARGESPAPPADIYALGLVLIEALSGTRPFADAEGIGAVVARLQGPPEIPDSLDEDWRRLLRWMTLVRPDDRPSALEVAVVAAEMTSRASGAPVEPNNLDAPTAAFISDIVPTGMTAVLPVAPLIQPGVDEAVVGEASSAHALVPVPAVVPSPAGVVGSAGANERGTTRRRRLIGAALGVCVLLVAAVIAASIWAASAPASVSRPTPSSAVEPALITPSAVPTPAEDNPAPVDVVAPPATGATTGDPAAGTTNPGTTKAGAGKGNPNKGPGNNSGRGGGNGKGGKG